MRRVSGQIRIAEPVQPVADRVGLERLRQELKYDKLLTIPASAGTKPTFDSPRDFKPREVDSLLKDLREQIDHLPPAGGAQ